MKTVERTISAWPKRYAPRAPDGCFPICSSSIRRRQKCGSGRHLLLGIFYWKVSFTLEHWRVCRCRCRCASGSGAKPVAELQMRVLFRVVSYKKERRSNPRRGLSSKSRYLQVQLGLGHPSADGLNWHCTVALSPFPQHRARANYPSHSTRFTTFSPSNTARARHPPCPGWPRAPTRDHHCLLISTVPARASQGTVLKVLAAPRPVPATRPSPTTAAAHHASFSLVRPERQGSGKTKPHHHLHRRTSSCVFRPPNLSLHAPRAHCVAFVAASSWTARQRLIPHGPCRSLHLQVRFPAPSPLAVPFVPVGLLCHLLSPLPQTSCCRRP